MSTRYTDIICGEWYDVTKDTHIRCCDCGLVHKIRYRVRLLDAKPRIFLRMSRDNRATAAVRRGIKKKFGIKKKKEKK